MPLELDTRQRAMLQEMGVQVWLPERGVAVLERVAVAPAVPPPPSAAPLHLPVAPAQPPRPAVAASPVPVPIAAQSLDWTALREAVHSCQACTLCAGRNHATLVAPAEPGLRCDWMVVGDPPDEDEDQAGAPFAGQDGLLLDNMLRALGAPLAYRSNVLKCRTAHGAVPQAADLDRCATYLQREIALVQPKIILAMGRFAIQVLLAETPELAGLPLGRLRGSVHRYQGVAVVVSYPPKLLMRNSADKAKAWADLCLAAATLEASLEAAGG
jgi:DNA polymerase